MRRPAIARATIAVHHRSPLRSMSGAETRASRRAARDAFPVTRAEAQRVLGTFVGACRERRCSSPCRAAADAASPLATVTISPVARSDLLPDRRAISRATIEVHHRPPLRSMSPVLKREPPGRVSFGRENANDAAISIDPAAAQLCAASSNLVAESRRTVAGSERPGSGTR
jgi:hypothetical protein